MDKIRRKEKVIKKVIETFFDGLHKGDSTILNSMLHKNIKIQIKDTNNKGEYILKN